MKNPASLNKARGHRQGFGCSLMAVARVSTGPPLNFSNGNQRRRSISSDPTMTTSEASQCGNKHIGLTRRSRFSLECWQYECLGTASLAAGLFLHLIEGNYGLIFLQLLMGKFQPFYSNRSLKRTACRRTVAPPGKGQFQP